MDQQPEQLIVAELHHQVTSLLRRPVPIRVRRARDVLGPSRRERDEEQDVDPLQKHRLDGQEVARQRGRRLLTQNARHDMPLRSGAGGAPAPTSTVRTVVDDTETPSPLSSPTIRR
jgi:hypothetical protein